MTYLLDMNACVELLNERDSSIARKLAATDSQLVVVCSIVKAELYHGAYKSSKREANLNLLARFFQRFMSLPFDDSAAEHYGRLRALLQRQGNLIGPNNLLIASIVNLLARFFQRFMSLPFNDSAAEHYGRLRALLQRQGNLIGPNNLLIASIALANNVTLVTHNTAEFSRVTGLQIEDWQA